MGNSASAGASQQQTSFHAKLNGAATSGRERDQASALAASGGSDGRQTTGARHVAVSGSSPQQRITVDIRSAQLDKDYKVYIRQEPRRDLEADVRSAWNGLHAVGGLLITVLTIQKLWEDIRFIRLLRRELSTIVGSLTDAGGGADAGGGEAAGSRPLRPPGGGGAAGPGPSHTASAAGGAAAGRHLDLNLAELSDILSGGRGAAAAAAAATGVGTGVGSGGPGHPQQQGQQTQAADASTARAARKETTWSSISGLTDVKILLQEATVLPTLRPDLFQGIRQPPKALLLFGPPGTGKTLLARAVATESRATFLPVTGSSVLSMWYGQSEQNVKSLFEKARRKQPAIIFIDEVDSLLGKRSAGGARDSTPDKRVTNEFLAFIDGIQTQQPGSGSGADRDGAGDTRVVVIAATNTPWDLDEAALSRFSRRIYVPLPDKSTREALMRKALEGVNCAIPDEEWQRMAERCDKYSGRDLVQVCREAAMRPLRELWGKRLLEGSAAGPSATAAAAAVASQHAAAQQRLVDLVAKSLAGAAGNAAASTAAGAAPAPADQRAGAEPAAAESGAVATKQSVAGTAGSSGASGGAVGGHAIGAGRPRPGGQWRWRWRWSGPGGDRYSACKKQARRELERWKRRHGASWCDVDAVMQAAEAKLAEAARQQLQQQQGQETSHAQRQDNSAGLPKEQERGQEQQGKEGEGQQQPRKSPDPAHASHIGGSEETCEAGAQLQRTQEQEQQESGTSRSPEVAGVPGSATLGCAAGLAGSDPGTRQSSEQKRVEGEVGLKQATIEEGPAATEPGPAAIADGPQAGSAAPPLDEGAASGGLETAAEGPDSGRVLAVPAAPQSVDRAVVEDAPAAPSAPAAAEAAADAGTTQGSTAQGSTGASAPGGGAQEAGSSGLADAAAPEPGPESAVASEAVAATSGGDCTADRESLALAGPAEGADGTSATPSAAGAAAPTDAAQPAAQGAAPSAAPSATAGVPRNRTASGSGAGAASAKPAAGSSPVRTGAKPSAAASPSAALSLEDLLTLPVDRVRPVTVEDLEAALQVISCTEMDQSPRYTEWDEQYGSGANAAGRLGGGRGSRWMSMYV